MGENQPLASKLNVNIDSMQDLTKNLKEDGKAFSDEMTAWNKTDRVEHPMNAQIGKFPGFEEGVTVFDNNFDSSLEVLGVTMQITNAVTFLQMGADNIAQLYGGEDALANIKLKQIEGMFPEQPFKPAGQSGGTPPLKDWKLIGNEGWDTNGDGKVDIKMPGSVDKSQNPSDAQRQRGVKDADGTLHKGYDPVFDTMAKRSGDNSWDDRTLSSAGQDNLASNQPKTKIMAPGAPNSHIDPTTGQPTSGSPSSGTSYA